MKENFTAAVNFALQWERWKSDIPNDPGGHTVWGWASRFWPEDVKIMDAMSEEDSRVYAIKLYHERFWLKYGCDDLQSPLDIFYFDCLINPGIGAAPILLANSGHDPLRLLFQRLLYYKKRADKSEAAKGFFRGWANRVLDLFVKFG